MGFLEMILHEGFFLPLFAVLSLIIGVIGAFTAMYYFKQHVLDDEFRGGRRLGGYTLWANKDGELKQSVYWGLIPGILFQVLNVYWLFFNYEIFGLLIALIIIYALAMAIICQIMIKKGDSDYGKSYTYTSDNTYDVKVISDKEIEVSRHTSTDSDTARNVFIFIGSFFINIVAPILFYISIIIYHALNYSIIQSKIAHDLHQQEKLMEFKKEEERRKKEQEQHKNK